jgi:hypothetical protein
MPEQNLILKNREEMLVSNPSSTSQIEQPAAETTKSTPVATESKPSYVKLAMRNMVQKRMTSLQHFVLTTIGLLAVLVSLAYLTR